MPTVRLGYRVLFDALGCKLEGAEEISAEAQEGEHRGFRVYMGRRPPFGIIVSEGERYIVPPGPATLARVHYTKNPDESRYPRDFFTEIFAFEEVDVDQAQYDRFHSGGHDELLKRAEAGRERFLVVLDAVAGALALLLHRQFALLQLSVDPVVAGKGDYTAIGLAGPWAELLEAPVLRKPGQEMLRGVLPALGKAPEHAILGAGAVLHWLLRAWREVDHVNRFVALFIPLELLLEGVRTRRPDVRRWNKRIRSLIRAHADSETEELLKHFDALAQRDRPSLEVRFQALAEEAGLEGWEEDVEAFARFNRMRNGLIHRGERGVKLSVVVGQDEARELEKILVKYVKWSLFEGQRDGGSRASALKRITRGLPASAACGGLRPNRPERC